AGGTDGRRIVPRGPDRAAGVPADGAGRPRGPPRRAAGGARLPARARGSRTRDGHAAGLRKREHRVRRLPLLLPFAAFAAIAGCSKPAVEEVETKAAAPVTTLTLTPQTLEGIVAATGVVAAAPGADWTITAPEHARILELPKAEGDRVKTGDLLVRFEIPSLSTEVTAHRGEVQAAQAHGENAQANVTRLTTLVEHGGAAQKELEEARRDCNEARAALAQAQGALQSATVAESRTIVRARFPGVVAKRAHNPADMVEATSSDVILRVIDPSKLQAVAAV